MFFTLEWFRSRQQRPTSTRTLFTTPFGTLKDQIKTDQHIPSDMVKAKDLRAVPWTIDSIDFEHSKPSRENTRDIPRTIQSGKQVETELQNRLDAIVALRNLVLRQRDTIAALRSKVHYYKERLVKVKGKKNRNAIGSFPDWGILGHPNEIFRKRTVSFSPSAERTDTHALSEDMLLEQLGSAEPKGISNDLKEAILSIDCQASKLDDAISLDEFLSLKIDLKTATHALETKDAVIVDLQREIREKNKRIGTLEIERDLIEADATEAREFPKHLFPDKWHTPLFATTSKSEKIVQDDKSPKQNVSQIFATTVSPSSNQKLVSRLKVRLYNIISPTSKSKSPKSQRCSSDSDNGIGPVAQHGEMDSCLIDFSTRTHHELVDSGPANVIEEDTSPARFRSPFNLLQRNNRQGQRNKLNDQLQESRRETEQLREHIWNIKCCCDDKIRSFQTDMAQLKQEKLRAVSHMNHMVYTVVEEKEQAIKRMQTKMRLKDSLIAQLQKACSPDIQRIEEES